MGSDGERKWNHTLFWYCMINSWRTAPRYLKIQAVLVAAGGSLYRDEKCVVVEFPLCNIPPETIPCWHARETC